MNPADSPSDVHHMRAALALGRRNLGATWPNPSVGCVIVREDRVVGRGTTQPGGRPHAEIIALAQAGPAARGATAYVTLEPCSHQGHTSPCADALIAAGIARVVIASPDPDPRVNGNGIARLRAAGVQITENLLIHEADHDHRGFLTRIRHARPMITLKLASTLDGRIATATGESQWITGPQARRAAHALRGTHDATLAGIGTVLADDPALTCRIPGFRRRPETRIVLDSHLRTPLRSNLVTTAKQRPTWILHRHDADPARCETLQQAGIRLLPIDGTPAGIDITAAMKALAAAGLTRVLVEGGATVAASLLQAALVDRIAWFHAPALIGAEGLPALQPFGLTTLAAMPRFHRTSIQPQGPDLLTQFDLLTECDQT